MVKKADPKTPPQWWFRAMDKLHSEKYIPVIIAEIRNRPDIQERIKGFEIDFVKYAALERMYYEADLDDELECYLKRQRLFTKNVKAWYRLRKAVFERDHYTCQYCGQVGGKLELDHVVPFSKGGSDSMSNLVTACRRCNRQKKDKSKEEFLKWKKMRT